MPKPNLIAIRIPKNPAARWSIVIGVVFIVGLVVLLLWTARRAPPVTHVVTGLETKCASCHNPDGGIMPAPTGHRRYTGEQCLSCHEYESVEP